MVGTRAAPLHGPIDKFNPSRIRGCFVISSNPKEFFETKSLLYDAYPGGNRLFKTLFRTYAPPRAKTRELIAACILRTRLSLLRRHGGRLALRAKRSWHWTSSTGCVLDGLRCRKIFTARCDEAPRGPCSRGTPQEIRTPGEARSALGRLLDVAFATNHFGEHWAVRKWFSTPELRTHRTQRFDAFTHARRSVSRKTRPRSRIREKGFSSIRRNHGPCRRDRPRTRF